MEFWKINRQHINRLKAPRPSLEARLSAEIHGPAILNVAFPLNDFFTAINDHALNGNSSIDGKAMAQVADTRHVLDPLWRQRLFNFGLTVMATVVGGLLVAAILWGIGALTQVGGLTTKVDLIEEKVSAIEAKADKNNDGLSRKLDDLKASVALLPDDTAIKTIEKT